MKARVLAAALALFVTTVFAGSGEVAATDGQMICGGSNVFSNVFVSSGYARANTCPVDDCPTYVNDCRIEYRWLTKCEWAWCTTFDDRSGWVRADTATQVAWCQNGKQQYKLEMRIRWLTSATKTVSTYGSDESVTEIGGSVGYKKVGRGFFNHTNGTGYAVGTQMKTTTAVDGYSDPVVIATSGSAWITLSC